MTAALTEILAKNNAVILDIGQADIHNNLSLGILFQSSEGNSGDILKELLFKSYELDVNIRFNPITEEAYNQWVSMQGKNRYIITILGRKLTARQIAGVTRIVADQDMNIDDIKRLTGRIPLDENARTPKASVEFSVRGTPRDKEQMKADFMKLSAEQEMDISFQEESMYRRMRRLICFDMDSTLIETEVIDELAIRAGVGDQVKAITEAAMRGEIDFCESFRQRCALLKGLDVSVMQEIAENLPITEGVERLMYVLKKYGYKIAILSGGFTYFGQYLQKKYGIDYVYANELEIIDGRSGKSVRVALALNEGYEPQLLLGCMTARNRVDALIAMDTGSSGAIGLYTVVGFVSGAYRTLFDSERFAQEMRYTVTYLDQYAVRAQSENTGMNYYIDLAGKDAAELTRIYREDGTLRQPQEGFVDPVSLLYPADVNRDGLLELVAWQRISGLYHADALGDFINTLAWNGRAFALASQTVGILGVGRNSEKSIVIFNKLI